MKAIRELIRLYEEDAVSIRRKIHRKPELSMQEYETTAFIQEKLLEYGLKPAAINLPSGTAAVLQGGKPGKTILFRADIDALPMTERSGLSYSSEYSGVCHSCGHDIHTAVLLLTARVLSERREALAGQIIFLFQPGEEQGLGANAVIDSGLFETYHPDFAVGVHCWPELIGGTVGFRKGPFMASNDSVTIRVTGRGGHGAHPHKSIDPITASAYILTQLQSIVSRSVAPLDSAVLTMGKIFSGTAANVIPDEAVMEGTVRAVNNKTRNLMEQRIRTIAACGAEAMGASCEIEYVKGAPALECDSRVTELLTDAALRQLGADRVVLLESPSMGSEDFANYLEFIPGAMFRIGTACENPASRLPLHNAEIVFDEKAVAAGASVFCGLAEEVLTL